MSEYTETDRTKPSPFCYLSELSTVRHILTLLLIKRVKQRLANVCISTMYCTSLSEFKLNPFKFCSLNIEAQDAKRTRV